MKKLTEALTPYGEIAQPVDWDAVYTTQMPRVYNFFLYRVGRKELAEDLTAATFERAWRHRKRYERSLASFPTWLFGIARNVFREHLRKNPGGISLEDIHTEQQAEGNLEEELQRSEEQWRLRKLLQELNEREGELVAMKYGGGLTNREIAKVTRLSESNVGSILHRVVKSLRARWEAEDGR